MSIILPNEDERKSRLDDILYALCTLSLLDEYDVPNEDRINEYYKALLTGDLSELTFMPKSRIEKLLHFLTIGTNEGIEAPKSRVEYLLYTLAGLMQVSALPFKVDERSSRHEKYLMYLIENGGVGVKSLTVSFFNNQEILNSKEGNIENLTFKGNTILPVIKENVLSEEIDTSNVECSGSEYEGEFKSAILEGNTLVNLFNYSKIEVDGNGVVTLNSNYKNEATGTTTVDGSGILVFEPDYWSSDTFLILFSFDTSSTEKFYIGSRSETWDTHSEITKGFNKVKIRVNSQEELKFFWIGNIGSISKDTSFTVKNFVLIHYQDGMENWDIPYFEGMTSVKMPILYTIGKNLFNGYNEFIKVNHSEKLYLSSSDTTGATRILLTAYDENKNLITSENAISSKSDFYHRGNDNKWMLANNRSQLNVQLTLSDDVKYIVFETDNGFYMEYENIQLEEGLAATSYEPYKTNILSTPSDLILRGIGNVKDELNLSTGKLTQRISEVVLDGSENWVLNTHASSYSKPTIRLSCDELLKGGNEPNEKLISDKIPVGYKNYDYEFFGISGLHKETLYIQIPRTMIGLDLEENTPTVVVEKFKKWFTTFGAVKVQYPLATESVKTVDLDIVDHNDNTLEKMSTFKDGHIILSSGEGSLIPSLTYSVARNDAFKLTNLKSNNTYTVQTNEKEFTLNGVTYPEIETSATTTASVDRVISIDDIYARVDNVEKMVLEGMNYGNLLQESGQDEFVSHASDENQTIIINDTVEGRLKDLTLKGDTLVNILPAEPTLRNEMTNSYSQKLNNDYDEVIVVDGEYKDLNVEGRTLLNLASVQNDSEANFYVVGEELNGQSIEIEQENFDYSVPRNLKDVTLEGSTYISKTASLINSMDNVSMQKLNEGYDEANVVDGEFKSAILKGNTLVNHINGHYEIQCEAGGYKRFTLMSGKTLPAGKYILMYNVVKGGGSGSSSESVDRNTPYYALADGTMKYQGWESFNSTVGKKHWIINTNQEITTFSYWCAYRTEEIHVKDFVLLAYQDGMENWDIPFFTGMQSVKMPVLTTTGKNLFDGIYVRLENKQFIRSTNYIKVKKGDNLIFSMSRSNGGYAVCTFLMYDNNKKMVGSKESSTIAIEQDGYIKFQVYTSQSEWDLSSINWIQIEKGSVKTEYEPYKSNTITCNEEVTLRGIGDVKDELNLLTGELIQKIGELTINAYNTNISLHEFYDNTVALKISADMVSTGQKQIICDSLPTITLEDMSNGSVGIATSTIDGDSYIYVSIPTDGLTTTTIQDICTYFTTNPINIKYPLAVKVVSEVELNVTDQDNVTLESPLAYNSGNITLSSDSILPSLDYEVQTLNSFSNLKPSTTYTIKKNTQDFSSTYEIGDTTYTTSNTLTTTKNNEVVVLTSTISAADKVALIEGNNIGIDIPYFEGMQSVEQPVLKVTGKNLFDLNDKVPIVTGVTYNILENGLTIKSDKSGWYNVGFIFHVKPSEKYTIKWEAKVISGDPYEAVSMRYGNGDNLSAIVNNDGSITIVAPVDGIVQIRFYSSSNEQFGEIEYRNIQLEEGSVATSYEPYKSNILTCNEEVTLRGIGDVKDELNLLTGELTQCIGEIVLDGSKLKEYIHGSIPSTHLGFSFTNESGKKYKGLGNYLISTSNFDVKFLSWSNTGFFYGQVNKNLLDGEDFASIKKFFSNNEVIVNVVELEPTVTTVDLSIVDQDNVPQSNLQLQTQLSHITTSSDTLIPIFNISATNNYDVQIKPSTQYTVRLSQDVVGNQLSVDLGGTIQTVTSNEFTITTPSTLVHEQLRIGGEGNVIGEIQLFEGNVTGLVNEYFDGMKVSKISNLTTTGKNLIPSPLIANTGLKWADGTEYSTTGQYTSTEFIKIQTGVYYISSTANSIQKRVHCYDKNKMHLGVLKTDGSIVNNSNNAILRDMFKIDNENVRYIRLVFYGALETAQLEQGSTATTYEPHKSNVLSTSEEVTLRGIGDVKDELNLLTGELTQRVEGVVFDGSDDEVWGIQSINDYGIVNFRTKLERAKNFSTIVCDKLPSSTKLITDTKSEGVMMTEGYTFYVRKKQEVVSTVSEWRKLLASNPLTVYYELETESVKTVDLSIVEQDENAINAPLAYQNGHIQVTTSEIAPIVNYEVPTSNSYHLDLAVNGGAYTVKGDNTNELITHNSEPLISDDTHLMVIEGDCVSKDVPYFEGMTSVQTPKLIISNCPFAFGKGGRI